MEKKIKRNVENCISALKMRFPNLNVYTDYGDIQVSINSTEVPSVADFKGIINCFFDYCYTKVEESWGFTEAYLSDGRIMDKRRKASVEMLKLYIPHTKHNELEKMK